MFTFVNVTFSAVLITKISILKIIYCSSRLISNESISKSYKITDYDYFEVLVNISLGRMARSQNMLDGRIRLFEGSKVDNLLHCTVQQHTGII